MTIGKYETGGTTHRSPLEETRPDGHPVRGLQVHRRDLVPDDGDGPGDLEHPGAEEREGRSYERDGQGRNSHVGDEAGHGGRLWSRLLAILIGGDQVNVSVDVVPSTCGGPGRFALCGWVVRG